MRLIGKLQGAHRAATLRIPERPRRGWGRGSRKELPGTEPWEDPPQRGGGFPGA